MHEGESLAGMLARAREHGTLAACGAAALSALIWAHAVGAGAGAGTDFTSYLTAAHDVARGLDPYRALVTQVQHAQPGDVGIHPHGYVYPPLLCALLALPLRLHASAVTIWVLWEAVNIAALLWMGFELNVTLRGRRDWQGALIFACACLLPAIATYDLWLGQTDLLMAALGVGACGLWLRGNRWAPLPLAAAIAIKPTMALLLVVWLWKGDWRATLWGALAAVTLLLAPFALAGGARALDDYTTFYLHWSAFNADAEFINQAPTGMLLRLFSVNPYTQPLVNAPWLVAPLRWLVAAGAAGCWLWTAGRPRRRHDPATGMLECLLALPLILLLSPLAEDIHSCLLIPTLVGFCYVTAAGRLWRQPATWAFWAALAFFCVPRMQELIYPSHLLALPGQRDPALGPLVILARSGTLLYLAILALLAGAMAVRSARRGAVATASVTIASPSTEAAG